MEDSNEISKVLFELSSNRRANILFKIEKENLKMQQIAKSLDMTVTETFRHLQRLTDAKLAEKNVDGTYAITSLGKLANSFLTSFNFILDNGDYFLEHDVSCLPYEFVNRLGELSAAEFSKEALSTLNRARRMVYEAEEYLWVIAEQIDSSHTQITNEKISEGLKLKFIMPKDFAQTVKVTPEMLLCPHCRKQMIQDESKLKERICGYCERRSLERICLSLFMNEKESCVLLRRANGAMDYVGFFGTDEKFLTWCRDLFLYYWERAEHWYQVSK